MKLKEKMKNNKHKKFDKKKLIGTISKKHIKNGSYTMVMSVIFIAVVVVLNMIVNAIPSKYSEIDISSQKLYSIGDDTKAMLKDLDKDVTIYQIAQSGSEDENITNLLKKYEDESKHIKVEQKDPVVNPKFASDLDEELLESLKTNHSVVFTLEDGVVEGGWGQRVASFYGPSTMRVKNYGIAKEFHDRYDATKLLRENGVSVDQIVSDVKALLS